MNRTLLTICLLLTELVLSAQSLTMQWTLVQNDIEPGVLEAQLTLTNHTTETLTASGDWLIGYCQMSTHPYQMEGDALLETEVCATYHTLQPTSSFLPLPPGATHIYRLYQRGAAIRQSSVPEGAFFLPHAGATPIAIEMLPSPAFTSPSQWTREANPGYADGEWMYRYNEPFCRAISSATALDGTVQPWYRPLHLVPAPKAVYDLGGTANLNAPVSVKMSKKLRAEGYRLTVNQKKITIEAADSAGLFYAQQTLARLRENAETLHAITVEDYPDLPHRGVMIDIARNYTPLPEMLKILSVMAAYKLNVLHLHLADDEAWRVEIPALPELTQVASRRGYTTTETDCLYPAYCGGADPTDMSSTANGFLSREDYIHLLRIADSLHITVIPEIDMPGHSRAAIRAMEARYERLKSTSLEEAEWYRLLDPDDASRYSSAQHYTDDVICIARPSCYHFVDTVLSAFIAMHREAGQPLTMLHVGGDEVADGAWTASPICRDYMRDHGLSDLHQLKDLFVEHILDYLRPEGIRLAGWEEIAMRGNEVNPRFAGDEVVSWCWNSIPEWRGDEKPYRLANAGYPVVLACVGNLYLDMSYTNHQQERGLHWGGYTDEHSTFDFLPYDIYRSVRLTMQREQRDIDDYDSHKTVRLSEEARPKILGLQGQLFSETIRSSRQLEEYLFPKLVGLAERAWNATPISYRCAREQMLAANKSASERQLLAAGRKAFEQERLLFSSQLYRYEMLRLYRMGVSLHIPQPGITIREETVGGSFLRTGAAERVDRMVLMNCPMADAVIRYTTDGSEPTEQSPAYRMPFVLPEGATVRACAFYAGLRSNITLLVSPED